MPSTGNEGAADEGAPASSTTSIHKQQGAAVAANAAVAPQAAAPINQDSITAAANANLASNAAVMAQAASVAVTSSSTMQTVASTSEGRPSHLFAHSTSIDQSSEPASASAMINAPKRKNDEA